MKYIKIYDRLGIRTQDEVFNFLLQTLKDTIRTYDFFVAWEKVLNNVAKFEVSLNILNSLIGKKDIKEKLTGLIRDYPQIVPVLPLLIAIREKKLIVAEIHGNVLYKFEEKKNFSEEEIHKIIYFVEQSGFLKLLSNKDIKNLVDYLIGVEVGLDTNARKNRSGTAMEKLIETYVSVLCEKYKYQYIPQATVSKIKEKFKFDVPTDKAERTFDFAIKTQSKLYLLEVNYYSGGGSKLKSVAGEFMTLFDLINSKDIGFIWITDGKGWETAKRPLAETFNATDYVLNIKMIEEGILEEILKIGL